MNNPHPQPCSYMNTAIIKMIQDTVDERIEEIVQHAMERLNEQPPAWFTSKMASIDDRFASLEDRFTSLEDRVTSLGDRVTSLEAKVEDGFNLSNYNTTCLNNMFRRMNGCKAIPVPYLDTDITLEHELPSIGSVEEIDLLDRHDCQAYLKAYNVKFHPNETVKLKERLRDAIGLAVRHDMSYEFSGFHD